MNQLVKSFLSSVAILTLLTVASVAAADDMMATLAKTTPQERATIQTAFLKSKLGLEGAEAEKVAAINLKYAEKADPIIKGSDGPFMKMRQMKELQSAKDSELQGVLTPAQYQAYEAAREEMKEKVEQEIAKKVGGGS